MSVVPDNSRGGGGGGGAGPSTMQVWVTESQISPFAEHSTSLAQLLVCGEGPAAGQKYHAKATTPTTPTAAVGFPLFFFFLFSLLYFFFFFLLPAAPRPFTRSASSRLLPPPPL